MKKPLYKKWWYWILIVLLWGFINSRLPVNDITTVIYLLGFPMIIIVSVMIGRKQEKKNNPDFFKQKKAESVQKNKPSLKKGKVLVNSLHGLPLMNSNSMLELKFNDEHFIIEEMGNAGIKPIVLETYKIHLKDLRGTLMTTEKEFVEKNKSAIGRGVAGGFLFGPAGLVLGGLSGVGKKQKAKTNYLYILSYTSADGAIKNITFTSSIMMLSELRKFDNSLKILIDTKKESRTSEIFL